MRDYITISDYQEIEIDMSLEKVFDQITDDQLVKEIRKRRIGSNNLHEMNGHTRELNEVIQKLLTSNLNHLEIASFIEDKYLKE